MAFPDPFNAPKMNNGSSLTKAFTLIETLGPQSQRKYVAAPAGEPKYLRISHTTSGKGTSLRNRHLVRLEADCVVGGVADPTRRAAAYAVFDIPANDFSDAQITDLWKQFVGILRGKSGDATDYDASVFWTKFAGGES